MPGYKTSATNSKLDHWKFAFEISWRLEETIKEVQDFNSTILFKYLNLIPKLHCLASKSHNFLIAPFNTLQHLKGTKDA